MLVHVYIHENKTQIKQKCQTLFPGSFIQSTLRILMDSAFYFDTINLGWFIVLTLG